LCTLVHLDTHCGLPEGIVIYIPYPVGEGLLRPREPLGEEKTVLGKHLWSISLRVLLAFGLLFCIYLVTTRAVAHWYFLQSPPEGLHKAIAWDPGNPMYYSALGRVLQQSSQETSPEEVIQLFETATKLSPHQARYWAELGSAYEWAGREQDALRAFERARDLFPNSPQFNWRLGNFYLREGKTTEALKAFQKVLLGDPTLREQTFDLALRATIDPELILQHMIPSDKYIFFQYLNYLTRKPLMNEANQAWNHLLEREIPFEPKMSFIYLNALIRDKRTDELTQAWAAVAVRNPGQIQSNSSTDDLIINGNLENEILNGGLAWRVQAVEGVVASVDSLNYFDGTHSLKIRFNGQRNVNYRHIFQYVPVHPNTLYHFTGYMRTKDITTDSGLRFQIIDGYNARVLFLSSENLIGTSQWSPQQIQFRTGSDTHLLTIRVARSPSRKLDNQISGTAWIDRISLRAIE